MGNNRHIKRRTLLGGVASLGLMSLIGCSDDSSQPGVERLDVSLIIPGKDSDYWGRYTVAGATQGAIDAGANFNRDVRLKVSGPAVEGAQGDFLQLLEGAVAGGPDALVIGTLYAEPTIPILEEAHRGGVRINLLALNVEGLDENVYGSLYYCDQAEQGVKMADQLYQYCTDNNVEMNGVVGLHMSVVVPVLEEKIDAFRNRISELAPDLELLDTLYNDNDDMRAIQNMEGQISRYGDDLFALAGFNANCGSAISRTLTETGLYDRIIGISTDSDNEEIAGLRRGAMKALILQTPYDQSYRAVYDAIDHIVNGTDFSKEINIPSVVATLDNLESPEIAKLLVAPQ